MPVIPSCIDPWGRGHHMGNNTYVYNFVKTYNTRLCIEATVWNCFAFYRRDQIYGNKYWCRSQYERCKNCGLFTNSSISNCINLLDLIESKKMFILNTVCSSQKKYILTKLLQKCYKQFCYCIAIYFEKTLFENGQ